MDLTSFGAVTVAVRETVENQSSLCCGAAGLAIILASDTPSNKGRPRVAQPKESNQTVPKLVDASSVLGDLPSAPADYQQYKDKGEIKKLLSQDYQKLLALGNVQGRYAEPCFFIFSERSCAKGVGIQPSRNSPWLHRDCLSKGNLFVGDPPTKFVEAGIAAGPLARRG